MHNFKELKVWQIARNLVKEVYLISQNFPDNEKFGLISQIRRNVISIPSNIAEGSGRGTDKDFVRFLSISLGSAYELETQVILSYDLRYINEEIFSTITQMIYEVQKMLYSLINKYRC